VQLAERLTTVVVILGNRNALTVLVTVLYKLFPFGFLEHADKVGVVVVNNFLNHIAVQ
jgi:hypothetical protein